MSDDWSSATDPRSAALKALAAHDDPSIEILGADGFPLVGSVERSAWVIAQMRTLVESPAVDVSATSSSDRYAAAREALATYDTNEAVYHALPDDEQEGGNYENYEDKILGNVHELASTLRALIEPPATDTAPGAVVPRVFLLAALANYNEDIGLPSELRSLEPDDFCELHDALVELGQIDPEELD